MWRRPHNTGSSATTRRASSQFPVLFLTIDAHSLFCVSCKLAANCPTREICITALYTHLTPPPPPIKSHEHTQPCERKHTPLSDYNPSQTCTAWELRASDGACKFSYVPTPYFSFLVGTQRDIVSVEAPPGLSFIRLERVRVGDQCWLFLLLLFFLSFLWALGSCSEQPFSTSDRTLRKGEEGIAQLFHPGRRPAKLPLLYAETETGSGLVKSCEWICSATTFICKLHVVRNMTNAGGDI